MNLSKKNKNRGLTISTPCVIIKTRNKKGKVREMMKNLGKLFTVIIVLFQVWFIISWFEVVLFNTSGDPQYSAWNLFEVLINWGLTN
ncbi:MAG: hypothetical protein E7167_01450 [Firmicutes bacterium]|nr:hypothetical protein [Bacillota bacterium]